MKYRAIGALLCSILLTAGCLNQGGTLDNPAPMRYVAAADGCVEGTGTAGTSPDASGTTIATFCPDSRAPTGWARTGMNRVVTETTAGKILVQATGIGMGIAGGLVRDNIQHNRNPGCEGGNCGGDQFIIQGGNALATNDNKVLVDANLTAGSPCGSKPCLAGKVIE